MPYICYDGTHEVIPENIIYIMGEWNNIKAVPENVFNPNGSIRRSGRNIKKQRWEDFIRLFTKGGEDMTPAEVLEICHNYKYYADERITDQGNVGTINSVAYLINQISSSYATIVFSRKKTDTITEYDFGTSITFPPNILILVENGAVLNIANGVSIRVDGMMEAPRTQCINCETGGYLYFYVFGGMSEVPIEWFGTDANALRKAVYASADTGGTARIDLTLGNTQIDIGNETVYLNKYYSNIKGCGSHRSQILVGPTGSLKVTECRALGFEDILISSSGTTNTLLDLSGAVGTYEVSFHRCRLSGGKYSLFSQSGHRIGITLDKTVISNDGADKYAIYIDLQSPPATPYFNALNLTDSRIAGNCYVNMDRTFNMVGTILECSDGTSALIIQGVKGGGIIDSYFETEGQTPIELGSNVQGFQLMGNMLDGGFGSPHIKCDGKACIMGGNTFISITSPEPQIYLESNSKYCRVLENYGGDYDGIPRVTNDGTLNEVWAGKEERIWISSGDLIPRQGTEYKELITNGDFEIYDSTGEDFPSTTFEDWDLNNVDENNKIVVTTTDTFKGNAAVKIIKTDTDCYLSKTIDITNLPVRRLINVSVRHHGDGSKSGMLKIYDVTNNSNILAKTSLEKPGTEQYYIYSTNFIRPVGCNSMRIELYPDSSPGAAEAYFDDVKCSVQGNLVSSLGMAYYSLPKGINTAYETCVKLPNNIIKQNGTNTAKFVFETYFMCSPGIESDVLADFYWGYSEVTENEVPDSSLTYSYAASGSHLPLIGGNILRMLTCSSGSINIPDLEANLLRIVVGRQGNGTYPSDFRLYGLMVRILHVTT